MASSILVAFGVAAGLTALLRRVLSRRGVVDVPNARSLHVVPVPRGAGVAVVGGVIAAVVVSRVGHPVVAGRLVAVAVLLGALGFADDLRSLPALARLALQVVIVVGVLGAFSLAGFPVEPWLFVVTAVAVLVFVNVYNFMDGINGLAASQAVVAGLVWAVAASLAGQREMAEVAAVTAAAACGFLPFNFPAARVFMGDAGSYAVGGWLAMVASEGIRLGIPPDPFVAAVSLFLFDACFTIVRRLRRGENVLRAHRTHIYQRLVQAGWSHPRTTVVCSGFMLAVGLLGLASLIGVPVARAAAVVAAAAALACYARLPRITMAAANR